MAEVKWIKITTDIFDDEKVLLIESLPDAYAIITVWFKLLCLAGKQNNSGVFMMGKIAYTDKMLATIFRMKESTVTMALQTFEQFGMVEIVDGVITIPNWGKHQNLDQLESKKQYMRNYMAEYRKKQKALTAGKPNSKVNSKDNVSQADKEERDKEIEEDIEIEVEEKACETITALHNSICKSFSPVKYLSAKAKAAIRELRKKYTMDDFRTLFEKAEQSDFLKGKNKKKWTASFDWLIQEENMCKVLNGNYDNKPTGKREIVPHWAEDDYIPDYEKLKAQQSADLQDRVEALKQKIAAH